MRVTRSTIGAMAMTIVLAACGTQGASSQRSSASAAASESPSTAPGELTGRIVFDRLVGGFGYESPSQGLFIRDLAAASEEQVDIEYLGEGLAPTWAPDATSLVVNIYAPPDIPGRPAIVRLENPELTVVEPDGLEGGLGCSDWSPDGSMLACSLDDDAHPDTEGIYTVAPDGTYLTRVTVSPNPSVEGSAGSCGGNDFAAAFSPDGTRIAFLRAKCGSGANPSDDQSASLWIVNSDGTDATEIVEDGTPNSHGFSRVRWSPDGTRLLFGSEGGHLYTVNVDDGDLSEILFGGIRGDWFAYTPDWSPDGSLIIFSLQIDQTDLYVSRPNGAGLTQVTDAPGAEVWASWTE